MPKNALFFDFWTPFFSGRKTDFSGILLKFLHRKIFSGLVPPKTTHLKIPSLLKSDATLRVESHFKFGVLNRFGSGGDQTCYFFRQKFSEIAKFFFRAFGPKIQGVQKGKKRSFFGITNVKNFEFGIQFFFLKKFSTHQCNRKGTLH